MTRVPKGEESRVTLQVALTLGRIGDWPLGNLSAGHDNATAEDEDGRGGGRVHELLSN